MCGISVIYKYSEINESDKENLLQMNSNMKYRGPDESGSWFNNVCGVVHSRLTIIGLKKGTQPLFNEDRSLVLVCNGEIYNYIELRHALIKKGHCFISDSDSEVILHLYEDFGIQCLEHLRGMFAFCLFDSRNSSLFAVRDRMGEKPLYFANIPCGIVLSSELKAIVKHFIPEPFLNTDCILETIRYSYPISRTSTYIQQVERIEPGSYLIINKQGIKKSNYWRKQTTRIFQGKENEAITVTRNLIKESVDLCMRSDVPIAILLSGGIDSSVIAALAKENGNEVHAITAGYKGSYSTDERKIAKEFSRGLGLIWHEIELNKQDYENFFEEYTQIIDEPVADIAAFAQWGLFRKIRELGFKVVLSGNGGDELFYGYPYYNNIGNLIDLNHNHLFNGCTVRRSRSSRVIWGIKNLRHLFSGEYFIPFTEQILAPQFYDQFNAFIKNENYKQIWENLNHTIFLCNDSLPGIEKVYNHLFNSWLTNNCLFLGDKLGMGQSLEVRSPFVDYKLIDFVASIPMNFKFKVNQPKYLLKKVAEKYVHKQIIKSVKKGFTPPDNFVKDIIEKYNFNYFHDNYRFFNAVVVDKIISSR